LRRTLQPWPEQRRGARGDERGTQKEKSWDRGAGDNGHGDEGEERDELVDHVVGKHHRTFGVTALGDHFILDRQNKRLTLRATMGLDEESVGKVSMGTGEGLTGWVIEKMKPVMV
jgi:hypothetical protein